MAPIRSIVFFAFVAVAVQSAVAWDFNIPGLFGSSFGLNSIGARNSLGGNIQLEDGAATTTVETPLGGFQTKVVVPKLPKIPDVLKKTNDNVNKFVNSIGNGFGMLSGFMHDTIDKQIKNFENVLNSASSDMNKLQAKLTEVVGNASGLVKKALESGIVSAKKIREFAAAIVQSSIKNSLNAGATLIDLLEKAIKAKLLVEKDAIILIRDAIEAGLHKTEGAVDQAVNQFLDAASRAGRISQDLANKLKALLRNAGSSAGNNNNNNNNNNSNNGAAADAAAANNNNGAAADTDTNGAAYDVNVEVNVNGAAADAAAANNNNGAAADTDTNGAADDVNVEVNVNA